MLSTFTRVGCEQQQARVWLVAGAFLGRLFSFPSRDLLDSPTTAARRSLVGCLLGWVVGGGGLVVRRYTVVMVSPCTLGRESSKWGSPWTQSFL